MSLYFLRERERRIEAARRVREKNRVPSRAERAAEELPGLPVQLPPLASISRSASASASASSVGQSQRPPQEHASAPDPSWPAPHPSPQRKIVRIQSEPGDVMGRSIVRRAPPLVSTATTPNQFHRSFKQNAYVGGF
mmetsp:Transcript_87727/g.248629  ORF Transcript_87727/g.248629 Transcript_87727/m.248629 type:complete len:137 (+) Transcript_87727:55-465(+)